MSSAWKFVIFLGMVSLCADMTYEGARSVTGAYLQTLGGTGTLVGLVAGFGELIGYGLRLAIGIISDRTKQFWLITTIGYSINTLAVPMLAFAGKLEWAIALMIAERTGKAIRTPPRDVLLSHAALQVGSGLGFGVHEALDQLGAVMGPLTVALMFAGHFGYQGGFGILVIPAIVGLVILLILQLFYPNPREFELSSIPTTADSKLSNMFWVYLVAVGLVAAGYADFPLIAFHFQSQQIIDQNLIPIYYAVAMGIDAIAALIFGYWFDKIGFWILIIAIFISASFAPLVFWGNGSVALLGMVMWGIGMGALESIFKAAIAKLVSADIRGRAYGFFSAGYGLAWFLGSSLMGVLYDYYLLGLIIFSVAIQLLAIPILVILSVRKDSLDQTI